MRQQSVVNVDRITLIYDDDSTNVIRGGRVRYGSDGPEILVEAQYVPREHLGMEIVAAHDDGSVEESFVVDDMEMQTSTRVYQPN